MLIVFIDIVGWIGAILILVAYYLVSNKKTSGDSKLYQSFNLFGAIGLIINTYFKGAIPSAALNVVWAIIAIRSLMK